MSNNFVWDGKSATRKLMSDISINISTPTPIISVGKTVPITGPHNPTTDAYRCCSVCGKHWNYHINGKCK
jgi:hypothetical protein